VLYNSSNCLPPCTFFTLSSYSIEPLPRLRVGCTTSNDARTTTRRSSSPDSPTELLTPRQWGKTTRPSSQKMCRLRNILARFQSLVGELWKILLAGRSNADPCGRQRLPNACGSRRRGAKERRPKTRGTDRSPDAKPDHNSDPREQGREASETPKKEAIRSRKRREK